MRNRTLAREIALQLLYEYDASGELSQERIQSFVWARAKVTEAQEYARRLVEGVMDYSNDFDKIFEELAEHWTVARMPVVDRNILRIGTYELLCEPHVPPKVAINEAVELAKRFGSADTGRFVNAILDRVHKDRGKLMPKIDSG